MLTKLHVFLLPHLRYATDDLVVVATMYVNVDIPSRAALIRDASGAGFAANPLDQPAPQARASPRSCPHGSSGAMRRASGAQRRRGARKMKGEERRPICSVRRAA